MFIDLTIIWINDQGVKTFLFTIIFQSNDQPLIIFLCELFSLFHMACKQVSFRKDYDRSFCLCQISFKLSDLIFNMNIATTKTGSWQRTAKTHPELIDHHYPLYPLKKTGRLIKAGQLNSLI